MKLFANFLNIFLILSFSYVSAATIILDGTTNIVYQNTNFVFHSDEAKGFVRLNAGFTVTQSSSAYLDTFITVSGGIDLRDTGTLDLLSDLYLSANFTFSNNGLIGGRLNGRGNTLHLGGDLALPSNRLLQIISDTIIDGHGHTLTIGAEGQILVDTITTLTLRNMTIQNTVNSENRPMIRVMDQTGKLALQNVTLDLGSDFVFRNGQLFIHDDVIVTGTSKVSYKSTLTSYIANNSTWYFSQGTGLEYYPSAQWKDLICMQDSTSTLFLDGVSLLTTSTGMRLTQGRLLLDNLVTLSSMGGRQPTTPSSVTTQNVSALGNPLELSWSPDGKFLISLIDVNRIQVFAFNNNTLTPAGGAVHIVGASTNISNITVSPDGRFFAVLRGGALPNHLRVYSFDGSHTPAQVGNDVEIGGNPAGISWSPDGQFIAVGATNLQIFSFDKVNTPVLVSDTNPGGGVIRESIWSPDGNFIALVIAGFSERMQVYSVTNGIPVQVGSDVSVSATPFSAAWSPDGRFIALISGTAPELQMYAFDGTNTPVLLSATTLTILIEGDVAWAPDGRFFAITGFDNLLSIDVLQIYSFGGDSNPPVTVGDAAPTGPCPQSAKWSPDGNFIALARACDNTIEIFATNYVADSPNNTPQAFTNSIVFGNSVLGSSANLNTHVLGGARVVVDGKILDDSI